MEFRDPTHEEKELIKTTLTPRFFIILNAVQITVATLLVLAGILYVLLFIFGIELRKMPEFWLLFSAIGFIMLFAYTITILLRKHCKERRLYNGKYKVCQCWFKSRYGVREMKVMTSLESSATNTLGDFQMLNTTNLGDLHLGQKLLVVRTQVGVYVYTYKE